MYNNFTDITSASPKGGCLEEVKEAVKMTRLGQMLWEDFMPG